MKIYQDITNLVYYSLHQDLIEVEDVDYCTNRFLNLLNLGDYIENKPEFVFLDEPSSLLKPILDFAYEQNLFAPNTITQRDLFESKIMDIFTPRPSDLNNIFYDLLSKNPKFATDYFYHISQKNNYVKTSRISNNIIWKSKTPYGVFDMNINLSKPEKDPQDIISSSKKIDIKYPKCVLCKENVGFYGNSSDPGRSNHRIIKLILNEEEFYLQYSPYVYYNEHSIVLMKEHTPMKVSIDTFRRLFDFVDIFPHYFLGSNAGLPIVGGSILNHEHYQGGRHRFPIEDAVVIKEYFVKDVSLKQLKWPMSVIRLESVNRESLIVLASKLFQFWEQYTNKAAGIYAFTDVPHNSITPIARKSGDKYILDVTLRNNLTSEEFPLGIFHPHKENQNIKKENIGLIEALGLAVLPARLYSELPLIKDAILNNSDLSEELSVHKEWLPELKAKYKGENIDTFMNDQVALKFIRAVEDAGVFKQTPSGMLEFVGFIEKLIVFLNK